MMDKSKIETVYHMATKGMVWDGNLISKSCRDDLVKYGYVSRYSGWNFLTETGVKLAHDMGLVKP